MDPNNTPSQQPREPADPAVPPEPAPDESKPDYATKQDMVATVNAAMASHLKRMLPKLVKEEFGPALDAAMAPIRERLERAPEPAGEKPKGDDPQVTALKKQLDDMTAQMRASQEEAAGERRKADEQALRALLRAEIAPRVRPEAVEDVVDLCFFRRLVGRDDQGKPTFTWRSALSKGMPEEDHEFPLADGAREFLKSKHAEIYIPPPNADNKSGQKSGQKLPAGTIPSSSYGQRAPVTEDEKLQRAIEITANLEARGMGIP
jgi:hypothetical protein